MTGRRIMVALLLVVVAVALQTTLFARLRPFDSAPALGLLVVMAVGRHLPDEATLLVGFGAGFLQDLLSETALGLWALVASVVAFSIVRLRERMQDDHRLIAPLVFAVSLGALALFALLGTIFGQKILADSGVIRKMVLPSLYNTVLAGLVFPFTTWAMGRARRKSGWRL